ncbi:MAG: hypothetical protein ACRDS0_33930 [Pseudonocardiaceae bacterium]
MGTQDRVAQHPARDPDHASTPAADQPQMAHRDRSAVTDLTCEDIRAEQVAEAIRGH